MKQKKEAERNYRVPRGTNQANALLFDEYHVAKFWQMTCLPSVGLFFTNGGFIGSKWNIKRIPTQRVHIRSLHS
jgi:hypothetical protein